MKVLLINTSERTGGAAVACGRLAKALRATGAQVKTLVRDKQTSDPNVVAITPSRFGLLANKWRFLWERLVIFASNGMDRSKLFKVSIANTGTDISRHPLVQEADILHLHWVNQGFLSLSDIEALTRLGKPIIWTMHDMWPFTGICHYAFDCDRYKTTCGKCPYLNSHSYRDLSSRLFNKKKRSEIYGKVQFVGCSRWIANLASESLLAEKSSICSIPNPIDTTIFKKKDKEKCRKELNLPLDKKLILFGAFNIADKRKGAEYLIEALQKTDNKDVELVVFGQITEEARCKFPVKVHSLGYLTDINKIVDTYNVADLFVISSLEDNLPNTIMESMACGTPCVGFNIGGIPEMIDHQANGYVARYKDSADLARGIEWAISNNASGALSTAALQKVLTTYTETIVANEYLKLYREER